jgi:sulfate/thiosulfate transport system substrate-binding protein
MLRNRLLFATVVVSLLAILAGLSGCGGAVASSESVGDRSFSLLNVSCDPTRELWNDVNAQFSKHYEVKTGRKVKINQSHGGSSSQARAVNDGLEADIVSLAMWPDTDLIRRTGLLADGWEDRSPHRSLPYYSTIVFVVRKGNPKQIRDWSDLARDGVQIITPNPKTSGNGKLSFLAAWGAVTTRGGSDADAEKLLTKIYQQTPVLDTAARAATITFSKKKIGDVHLTWENEAHLEVNEAKGELEIVYPPVSIRAEPHVTWVDGNVKRHGTEQVAKDFVEYLFTPEAQKTIGKHFYRPIDDEVRSQFTSTMPENIKLFEITAIAKDWNETNRRFFDDGAMFDKIFERR